METEEDRDTSLCAVEDLVEEAYNLVEEDEETKALKRAWNPFIDFSEDRESKAQLFDLHFKCKQLTRDMSFLKELKKMYKTGVSTQTYFDYDDKAHDYADYLRAVANDIDAMWADMYMKMMNHMENSFEI